MNRRLDRAAFTLVELLVVIAIIGVLVGLLLPAVQAAREAARMAQCKNNLRQIGIALHNRHTSHNAIPSGWTANVPDGNPGTGWGVEILPGLEQGNVYDRMDRNQPISAAVNQFARETVLPVFVCPSDAGRKLFSIGAGSGEEHEHEEEEEHGHEHHGDHSLDDGSPLFMISKSNYVGVFGSLEIEDAPSAGDGVFFHNSSMNFGEIKDGLSNTLVVGERSSRYGGSVWHGVVPGAAEAMARIVGVADHPPNDDEHHFDDFSSEHPSGAHFLLGDGSVRIINDTIDIRLYQGLSTRRGGEVVTLP